ncbi:A24 family peptidase [uncultured Acetatifactor sp.]|jgi:prepilin signal peptidase PulO-like enzyme (type II secretory pathway)|uniref:prepilin peptidase n=1 Tax=uncultured Acetatifactor sp. TaxID=1671927 RepID=UPI00262002B5|nr:A24 family peptidase [uncultured Acetatifactor sp.]
MAAYMTLALGMALMPGIYFGSMMLYRPFFRKEGNRRRIPLRTVPELVVMLLAELALVRSWWTLGMCSVLEVRFQLLFVMLTGMTFFSMTDYWEQIVPNRMLLVLLLLFLPILGWQGIRDMDGLLGLLPSVVLGLLFSMVSFGLGYLISRGSMGAGDVKLALVMGLYLTGEYAVGAVFYGCIAGAAFSMVQLIRKKLSRKDTIPFVPFLFLGLIIRLLAG